MDRTSIVLMADPRVRSLPVQECGEPLVDLRDTGELALDARLADPAGAYAHVRAELADRLLAAQRLLPRGLRLLVVEGYRPPALQRQYFDEYAAELRRDHPDWPEEHLHAQASRFVAPPAVGPHVSGAAVDLTLGTESGDELPMGTEVNATPEQSDGACYTDAPVPAEARQNRRVLVTALASAGLVNYPTEWWHWSYGDRYWALTTGARAARYGPLPALHSSPDPAASSRR